MAIAHGCYPDHICNQIVTIVNKLSEAEYKS